MALKEFSVCRKNFIFSSILSKKLIIINIYITILTMPYILRLKNFINHPAASIEITHIFRNLEQRNEFCGTLSPKYLERENLATKRKPACVIVRHVSRKYARI